jgi:hypothetical protein
MHESAYREDWGVRPIPGDPKAGSNEFIRGWNSMNSETNKNLNVIASAGLALGGVFGLVGTFVGQANLRNIAWEIDGLGLIMATSLLAIKFFRKGCDAIAAGFLVFAIGEAVMLSGMAAGLAASVPAFAAGTALWATAMLLISFPREFSLWVRLVGFVASVLFFVTATEIFWGEPLTPLSSPLPFFGYPFLVITFVGWIWSLLKESRLEKAV